LLNMVNKDGFPPPNVLHQNGGLSALRRSDGNLVAGHLVLHNGDW